MAHYGPEEWFYANGVLAANQRAAVFGPGNDNTYAPIFSDPGMTVPLANPTTTDANGLLEFYAPDGQYWVFVGPESTGDSVLVTLGVSPDNPVLSVNGIAPDGAGNVEVTAADVGAIASSLIDAKGDLIVGTANDTAVRQAVGSNSQVLSANSGVTNGVEWRTLTADVTVEFVDDRPVLTTGNGQARWYNRAGAGTIVGAWVSAGVVPTGADIIVDVNLNGTTIFTTQANRPTVPATTNGGAISATPDVTALANGDYFTVDIDQIGSTIAGGRITVGIVVRRTL